jgi:hypothetical protein
MSCPRADRNDNGPGRISDQEIRNTIASQRHCHPRPQAQGSAKGCAGSFHGSFLALYPHSLLC